MQKIFYFVHRGKFLICDLECISQSERTFDIHLFDLANNKKLLNILNLHSFQGNGYKTTGEDFSNYLAAFKDEGSMAQSKKSFTNPVVRLLVEDVDILAEIKNRNILKATGCII